MTTEIQDIKRLAWKPYPEKNEEERLAYDLEPNEFDHLSAERRAGINALRADYVGKLQKHRSELASDYRLLKEMSLSSISKKDPEVQKFCEKLILEYRKMEAEIDEICTNLVFRGLRFCKIPEGYCRPKVYANSRSAAIFEAEKILEGK